MYAPHANARNPRRRHPVANAQRNEKKKKKKANSQKLTTSVHCQSVDFSTVNSRISPLSGHCELDTYGDLVKDRASCRLSIEKETRN